MSADKASRKAKVVEVLNNARGMELLAVHQYMHQHYNLDSKDYGELAAKMKLIAIDEMRHAEAFAERVKELGGDPATEPCGKVKKNQDVAGIYTYDAMTEDNAIEAYNTFLKVCQENGDVISARLFENIIDEEQTHMTYFENVGEHIATLGDAYLSKIAGTPSSTGPASKGFANQGPTAG